MRAADIGLVYAVKLFIARLIGMTPCVLCTCSGLSGNQNGEMHAAAAAVFAPAARTRRWTQEQLHRMQVVARQAQQRRSHLYNVPRSKQGKWRFSL